jgi:hypothetical protein
MKTIEKQAISQSMIGSLIFVLIMILSFYNCGGDKNSSNSAMHPDSSLTEVNTGVGSKEWILKTKKSMDGYNTFLDPNDFSTKGEISNEVMSLNLDEINNITDNYSDKELKYIKSDKSLSKLYKENCSKANTVLEKILPSYRKIFSTNLHNTLWSQDIYVTSSNKTLSLTGAFFAKNANIEMVYNMIVEDASHFGFKKIIFRWYKGQEDYQFYKIKTKMKY